ncbi:MAG: LamG-like jellyroll fold domain-containing protein [Planctomycetota bacterium]|jgi:prepilin-type N-terminal cleavage/methylation domain-containing protein
MAKRGKGFTLVEILVVCSLLAIIMGLGAAFLGSMNRVMAVQAEKGRLDSLLRVGHNSASLDQSRAWVILDPQDNSVMVRSMALAGQWHFEDEDLTGFPPEQEISLGSARLSDPRIDKGKIGRCLVFNGRGSGADLGRNKQFEKEYGIAVEAWVFPFKDNTGTSTIFRLGKGLKLTLSDDYLEGQVLGVGSVDNSWGSRKSRSKKNQLTVAVPTGRWSFVSLSFDGTNLELRVNGALAGCYPPPSKKKKSKKKEDPDEKALRFKADKGSPLIVGAGFSGRIDEVRVSAVMHTEVHHLDANVRIDTERTTDLKIHFAPGGWLDETYHPGPVRIVLTSRTDAGKAEVIEVGRLGTIR